MPARYAVVGHPVRHSKSPFIHQQFAAQTGEDIVYDAIEAPLEGFEAVVRGFREAGGKGLNVTVPFKHRAYVLADVRSARAEAAQAVNTLDFSGERGRGDNTDGVGLLRDLTQNLGASVAGRRILLMGAGGASYGVCAPLLDEQPALLVVVNRTPEKAVELRDHFRRVHAHPAPLAECAYSELGREPFDVVINATSAGLAGSMPPLVAGVFATDALAYEMLYGQVTPFMRFAAQQGARVSDGLGMLVEQAAESFHVWRGVRPHTAPVIAALRGMLAA